MISEDIDIKVNGEFKIGKYAHIGPGCKIRGNNVTIGDHFYCSGGLNIGGGGSGGPYADLVIGDRCTMHNNFINLCEPVFIGNDVGLSPEVSLITHGFWKSVMDGFPRKFAGISIFNGCILGYRATVLPGVIIHRDSVVGACSVVTKEIPAKSILVGNPAKVIGIVEKPSEEERRKLYDDIRLDLIDTGIALEQDTYPIMQVNDFAVDLTSEAYFGVQDETTDKFRDVLRHWGIRIYTERPFG